MFKSIRKGGRIIAATIGIVAALTPLAAPPAALADGLPTPELEKSITVDGHNVLTYTDNGRYAVIEESDSDYNVIGYSRVDLTSGETVQINIPKSSLSTVHVSCDDECLCWLDEDGLIVYSIEDQQETTHPISAKKAGVSSFALAENGKTLTIEYSNKENETTRVDLFDFIQMRKPLLTSSNKAMYLPLHQKMAIVCISIRIERKNPSSRSSIQLVEPHQSRKFLITGNVTA